MGVQTLMWITPRRGGTEAGTRGGEGVGTGRGRGLVLSEGEFTSWLVGDGGKRGERGRRGQRRVKERES